MTDIRVTWGGCTYAVSVDYPGYLDGEKLSAPGSAYVNGVIGQLPQALSLATLKLLRTYNDNWLDDDHPNLTEAEFTAKLTVERISVLDEPNQATVYLGDGDMFGGHSIEVVFYGLAATHANIVG
jgi:hypothetical protein